jgi:hypothetical protein
MKIAVLWLAMLAIPAVSCSNDHGALTGQVHVYGGPSVNGKQALNGEPEKDWQVRVLSGARVIATARSDAAGHFTFDLPAGSYQLDCGVPQPVTVRSGELTTAPCIASVP